MDESQIFSLAKRVSAIATVADRDYVLSVMNDVELLQKRAREIKWQLETALIDYIDEHGEIEVGDKRWYVGVDRTYKPAVSLPDLVGQLMSATDGNFDRFCELLSAGAFKPAACRDVLGDDFSTAFETIVKRDLQTGKPKCVVKTTDKRFQK